MANCDTSDIKPIWKFCALTLYWYTKPDVLLCVSLSKKPGIDLFYTNSNLFTLTRSVLSYYNWNAMGHPNILLTLWWPSDMHKYDHFNPTPHTSSSSIYTTFLIVWKLLVAASVSFQNQFPHKIMIKAWIGPTQGLLSCLIGNNLPAWWCAMVMGIGRRMSSLK